MINLFYIALAVLFAAVIVYMVVYNLRHKTPTATRQEPGRAPVITHEGIATPTDEKKLKD